MRALLFLSAMFLAVFAVSANAANVAETLYVSPDGNDNWTGTQPAPAPEGDDGPLATLQGARDALRRMKGLGPISEQVRVMVRQGVYHVEEPLVFGPEDSGGPDAPIFYEAYPGETPVIHGGRAVTGWRQEGNLWVADIPEGWDFSALWVNGKRRQPARTPNPAHEAGDEPADTDFFYAAGPVIEKGADGKEAKSATKFQYREGDLQAWPSLKDATVVVFHSWATSIHRVKNLDTENRIIEFTGPARWHFAYWRPDQWYFIEHLFEGLDQPGEWFFDRAERKLFYMPTRDEDMATAEVIVPVAKQLVRLEGQPSEGRFVENLTFRGLRFHYTEYTIEPEGHSDGQAAYSVPATFEAVGARNCVIDRCEIAHTGNYAVWFRTGCTDNLIQMTECFDLGAGGVRIGEGGSPTIEANAVLRNKVDNCFLHDGGRIFRSAIGVWIGRSSHNTISHNEICDFRYTGVSIGWSWGYDESSANNNILEFNHIHHCGHGQLSDMGAVYTLGVSPGTVLRYNVMHDIMSNPKVSGGWGIYFDEGSTGILAEKNVVYNTLTGTLHQHYGKENKVINNVLAYSHREQLIRSREEEHISFFFERNIVLLNNGRLLGSNWKNGQYRLDRNVYWDTSGVDVDFAGRTFEEWQAEGNDQNSGIVDPQFENPEQADFRLKPNSPPLKMGIESIDTSMVGLYGDAEWVNKPREIPRAPFAPPAVAKAEPVMDGFEDTAVGVEAAVAVTMGQTSDALVRVTDETAAEGAHSLKFTDAAGLKNAFEPYLVYPADFRKGKVMGSFDIRLEPGAVFYNEWRDDRSPYNVGPSVWFDGEGHVKVAGRDVTTIPVGQWAHIDIECVVGRESSGTWTLTVTAPGKEPQRFENLPFGSSKFHRVQWYGFVSTANGSATVYIDNVNLRGQDGEQ